MEEKNTIGTNLFNIRNQKGETQEQVAESVGISYVSLSRYETGQRMPKMNILAKLADHYGVTIDSLIGTDTKKEPTASDGQTSPVDGNLAAMYAKFSLLSPADQQRVLDFAEGILSAREQ